MSLSSSNNEPSTKRQKVSHPGPELGHVHNNSFQLQASTFDSRSFSATDDPSAQLALSASLVGTADSALPDSGIGQTVDIDTFPISSLWLYQPEALESGPTVSNNVFEENSGWSALVCFGMVLDLPFVPSASSVAHSGHPTTLAYDVSNALLFETTNKRLIGSVLDSKTKQFLSSLSREEGVELQFQLKPEHSTRQAYSNKGKKNIPVNSRVDIVVYGPFNLFDDIGEFFQDNGYYLQEPRDCDRNVPYRNPHSLSGEDNVVPLTSDLGKEEEDFVAARAPDILAGLETIEILPEDQDPPGLTTPLYRHQKQALTFMKRREKGWALQIPGHDLWNENISPTGVKRYTNNINGCEACDPPLEFRGGILADDMGLGKTLSMIALIASDLLVPPAATLRNYTYGGLQRHVSPAGATRCEKIPQYVASTLLVVPASVLQQWENQLKQHL
ncbi:SNF2 family N-terminal domain-containing protein [Aspergillus filifer]